MLYMSHTCKRCCRFDFSTQCPHGRLTAGFNCRYLAYYTCAQNSSYVDQLPFRPDIWQGQSRLLGWLYASHH